MYMYYSVSLHVSLKLLKAMITVFQRYLVDAMINSTIYCVTDHKCTPATIEEWQRLMEKEARETEDLYVKYLLKLRQAKVSIDWVFLF